MLQVKKSQVLGPNGICSMVYLQPWNDKPALLSNGHWAVLGEPALRMRASVASTWGDAVLDQTSDEDLDRWELSEEEFSRGVDTLGNGGCGCVYKTPEPLFAATFNPDERQHELIFEQFFGFDSVEQLVRRPLTVLSGVQLTPKGKPEAYSWTYSFPTNTTFWVWAEYIPFFLRIGGSYLEYPVGARVVLIKNAASHTVGALALYHP